MDKELKYIFFLILSLFLIGSLSSKGCTCMPPYYYNFKDALTLHPLFRDSENTIVLGLIREISEDSVFINVDIIELISGEIPSSQLIVTGQDGLNCAVPFSNGFFNVNDTLIMCLIEDFTGRIDTLELNDCSLTYLKYEGGEVIGNITDNIFKMDFEDFKTFVTSGFTVSSGLIAAGDKRLIYKYYPGQQEIIIMNPNDYITDFRIFDIGSRLVVSGKVDNNKISVANLRNNIYFVQLFRFNQVIESFKLGIYNIPPKPK